MPKVTKFVRLGLTPELSAEIEAEAKRQNIGVNQLIRTALEKHLKDLTEKADKEYAALVLKIHFDEDRTECLTADSIRNWRQH
jgi:hypothetical protein